MGIEQETSEEITENPLIIYLNRLQRQMIIITDLLYNSNTNVNHLKRRMLGLIDNLPPQATDKFSEIIGELKQNKYINLNTLASYYNEIHSWAYRKLFVESNFGITPTATLKGDKETPDSAPLKPETSRI